MGIDLIFSWEVQDGWGCFTYFPMFSHDCPIVFGGVALAQLTDSWPKNEGHEVHMAGCLPDVGIKDGSGRNTIYWKSAVLLRYHRCRWNNGDISVDWCRPKTLPISPSVMLVFPKFRICTANLWSLKKGPKLLFFPVSWFSLDLLFCSFSLQFASLELEAAISTVLQHFGVRTSHVHDICNILMLKLFMLDSILRLGAM